MYIEPNVSLRQSKYWSCPNNSFPGLGVGFGVWNNVSNAGTQEGQLSFVNTTTTTTSSTIYVYSLRITVYIQFMTKNY